MRQVVCTEAWWRHDHGPLLAYTRDDHRPVALLPVSPTRYHLFDPRDGSRTPVQARVAATLAPVVYTFYRPLPLAVRSAWGLLVFGMRGQGRDLLRVWLTGCLVTLLGMLMPYVTAIIVDTAVPDADRGMLLQLGAALLAAACGQGFCQLAQGYVLLRQEVKARAATQAAMWDRLLHVHPAFFRQHATGDLLARVMAITQLSHKLNGTTLRTIVSSGLALLNLALLVPACALYGLCSRCRFWRARWLASWCNCSTASRNCGWPAPKNAPLPIGGSTFSSNKGYANACRASRIT